MGSKHVALMQKRYGHVTIVTFLAQHLFKLMVGERSMAGPQKSLDEPPLALKQQSSSLINA